MEMTKRHFLNKEISLTDLLKSAYRLMFTAKTMTDLFEQEKKITSKYVHATSRGHEAIQLALGMQLLPQDFVSPYYRDDSILLGIGITPYELMLQLLAKRDDPFSGGRTYYAHPSLRRDDFPKIIHQSSGTGMQAIPTTGIAMGMKYKEETGIAENLDDKPIAVCSLGDASCTEGEVSEAFQMAALKQLPILYLVQDNEWDISASADEIRAQDITQYMQGFNGIETRTIDGTDFIKSYETVKECIKIIREERRPMLIHAKVPLLNHHTSGVRKEWYRDDLEECAKNDPLIKLRNQLSEFSVEDSEVETIEKEIAELVRTDFENAVLAEDPKPEDAYKHDFAPTPITEEKGERSPNGKIPTVMVDCALFAIRELMTKHPEALLYGQDVGLRLGGVFREAITLAAQFGEKRVFNTPIQEAFIVGSTVGMSAVGLKPIVEVQFADYIWPGLNQLFTEVSRSYYLSNGKWPVSMILRVPIGAYGSGGPYHSSSVESVLTNIKGIKIAYPSTGADLKGLMKAAFYDPNPVVMLEHKGLYWSKIEGTENAKTIEPDEDYIIPFGKAREVLLCENHQDKPTLTVITYGMGVYWASNAAKEFDNQIEIIDLRTLAPLDENRVFESVKKHNRCIVLTEEPVNNSFAQSLAARISDNCFRHLDAPVKVVGAKDLPAIPINSELEKEMLPNTQKLIKEIKQLLKY
ncbi:tungsten formylmethanofuran dehydrogenase [Epilithonimonas sp. JDS]|uniref:alpha-ketoacid dehydrogenase subunit alpha/beta n=1 Tax=Epilithonimonas sp. JDS TaxID=2902797 RepID=UPI001E41B64F|nr:alpha-ketoacid dehydrogenase subunit alpha/beta [Epilithonimonas sp. JDS]MCD9856608.1 tungsten formylmethanofuran dehydrogenase [Epilithonimonas sp. JDS]